MIEIAPIAAGFLGGGGLVGILHIITRRRILTAQSRSVEVRGELQLVGGAMDLVEQLRIEVRRQADSHQAEIESLKSRLSRLETENHTLEQENRELRARCTSLEQQIHALQLKGAAEKGD